MLGWVGRFSRPHRANAPSDSKEDDCLEKEGVNYDNSSSEYARSRSRSFGEDKPEGIGGKDPIDVDGNQASVDGCHAAKQDKLGDSKRLESSLHFCTLEENPNTNTSMMSGSAMESDLEKDDEGDEDENAENEEMRYDAYGFSVGPLNGTTKDADHREWVPVPADSEKQHGRNWDKHIERLPKVGAAFL
jgi:hypothetical protein